MLTAFGITSATVMVAAYSLEERWRGCIAVFAGGCAATALYGMLTASWVFAALESIWAVIASRRYTGAAEAGQSEVDAITAG